MLAAGMVELKGVIAPEALAANPGRVEFMLDGLRHRGVDVRETVTTAG